MFVGLFQWIMDPKPLPKDAVITGIKWSRNDQSGHTSIEKLPHREVEASINFMLSQGWRFDGFTYLRARDEVAPDGYRTRAAYLKA